MSPTTYTSGWPGRVRSAFTEIRPALSIAAPVCSASWRPSGEACTPAAQTTHRLAIREVPPWASRISMPVASTPVTIEFSHTSTPRCCSCLTVRAESRCPNVPSTESVASTSTTSASAGSMERKLSRSVRRATSVSWPAISTPVGPAPTTTNRIHSARLAGSVSSSAASKAPKIRARSVIASSMLFSPGAFVANSGWPK